MKNGQVPDLSGIVYLIILVVIVVPIIALILSMITNTTCSTWITQANDNAKKAETNWQLYQNADANYQGCLTAYNTLEQTKITKDDFARFNGNIEKVLVENGQIKQEIGNILIQLNQIQNITNNVAVLWVSITIDIALFSAAFIEIIFFRFKNAQKITTKIYHKLNKTEIHHQQIKIQSSKQDNTK